MKYTVKVPEVRVRTMLVEAASPEEAIKKKKIQKWEGDEVSCEYSGRLHSDTWPVCDADGKCVRNQR